MNAFKTGVEWQLTGPVANAQPGGGAHAQRDAWRSRIPLPHANAGRLQCRHQAVFRLVIRALVEFKWRHILQVQFHPVSLRPAALEGNQNPALPDQNGQLPALRACLTKAQKEFTQSALGQRRGDGRQPFCSARGCGKFRPQPPLQHAITFDNLMRVRKPHHNGGAQAVVFTDNHTSLCHRGHLFLAHMNQSQALTKSACALALRSIRNQGVVSKACREPQHRVRVGLNAPKHGLLLHA
jgi:hypothetical protein